GQSLTFDVQGTDLLGHVGDPATSTACVDGWSTPVAADITLSALDKPASDFTDTATLTVSTALGVTVTGLPPGATYATTVTVTPVGHAAAATPVAGSAITGVSSAWPAVTMVSSTPVIDPSADNGALSVTIAGAYGNVPAGQTETLIAAGAVS